MCKMKYLILPILAVALLLPLSPSARADEVSYEDSWKFLYEFQLTWQDGRVTQAGSYHITTGEMTGFVDGAWSLVIQNGEGQAIGRYSFDPVRMAQNGMLTLRVPTEGSGATAVVLDSNGIGTAYFDIRGSRVCNDNGVCEGVAGERGANCPSDCGTTSRTAVSAQTASIGDQVFSGAWLGALLLRLSLGAAGLLLLAGLVRVMDSRPRA